MARVLVLDNEAKMRTLVRRVLERLAHDVVEAETGTAALSALTDSSFDLLITDLQMPEMEGDEVIARARQADPGLVILLMSGSAATANGAALDTLGASLVLPKPFGVPELTGALTTLLV